MNDIDILIVEDSLTQAEQLRYTLEQYDYHVTVSYNGLEAIENIKKRKPTIVISDVVMPEMDGYELCRQIKSDERFKDIPVILLTSLSEPVDVINGLKCGTSNFIIKPYNEQFLLSRIRHILANMELRKNGIAAEMGIEVFFAGQKHYLNSERIQILDLLLSTFENAVQKNIELEQSNKELTKALETIKILEADYRALLERNADAMVVVDTEGVIRYLNPAAEILLGRNKEELLGELFDFPVMAGETKEVNITRKDGVELIAEVRVADTNWEGNSALIATLRDVTDNVQLREKLISMSLTDELTGLCNRRGFLTLAQQQLALASRTKREVLLLYGDLDNLKWINDNLGHHEGDRALIETANILKNTFRDSDIIGRIGGDEFAILMLEVPVSSAEALIARLREKLDVRNAHKNYYKLSISVGITHYDPESNYTIEQMLVEADKSMYEQKRDKRH
ncbi:diguanylate cyclase [Pelotomaculum terephthalicicum JT]|uniref:diguanylate cyclase n=1 Tax=Pelotomaculum TaxID=191373 RepID=UPI0009D0A4B4|nr:MULTISPECIES: diguanylate cyclase [Pelotomaculum]MCG9967677.1 diguanylate cyclase [Pelotomaculum terephthalicicum JT]OPX84029.1 MAG: putative diguanylate cyclase AdrA [Pelotomaculum sp. PtaB.Bin117]OPY61491.1 MAG: putative diguanylate cyclase AdrA [Pelotomaculum sp. PtaU1.Bin065]